MSKEKLFSFKVDKYDLGVVSFKGTQAVSELYRYDIELTSKDADIDFDEMLSSEVCLVLHNKGSEDNYIHGVLEQFEAYQKIDGYIYYRATLVPKLWWLSIAYNQQIFLNQNVPDILEEVLKESHFTSSDYEFRLKESYDKREYVCQYKESRYDFMRRWMQRNGLYFYFEQDKDGCKLIITDAKEKEQKAPVMDKLIYSPSTGMQSYKKQRISSIVYRSNNTIKSVHMKNFNYEKPSLDINTVKNSKGDDYTQSYMFGHNILTQDKATKLTKINEQRFMCQAKEMLGESNIIALTPGYIYSLKDYFRDDLNDDYLMIRVDSEGYQRGFLTAGFTKGRDDSSYYKNSFTMIPSQIQFRDEMTVEWPYIGGILSAVIDGSGSGDTAELDKDGRYKVIMPFDISGRKDAKASAYLRMAQPSAGTKQGMHFPLHKGTEVLVAFKGGDPDQPIIMSAVPNINSPSPVNDKNATKSAIETYGGNIIHMEDTPGKAQIHMSVHDKLSYITIKEKNLRLTSSSKDETILGDIVDITTGSKVDANVGVTAEIKLGGKLEWTAGTSVIHGGDMIRVNKGSVKTKAKSKSDTIEENLSTKADSIITSVGVGGANQTNNTKIESGDLRAFAQYIENITVDSELEKDDDDDQKQIEGIQKGTIVRTSIAQGRGTIWLDSYGDLGSGQIILKANQKSKAPRVGRAEKELTFMEKVSKRLLQVWKVMLIYKLSRVLISEIFNKDLGKLKTLSSILAIKSIVTEIGLILWYVKSKKDDSGKPVNSTNNESGDAQKEKAAVIKLTAGDNSAVDIEAKTISLTGEGDDSAINVGAKNIILNTTETTADSAKDLSVMGTDVDISGETSTMIRSDTKVTVEQGSTAVELTSDGFKISVPGSGTFKVSSGLISIDS